ncbi:MAG: NAD(P)/FAD-dependent oxidoreductase, partial [Nannocystaceae bacterium]
RILAGFHADLSRQATDDLERLGVGVWTGSRVTNITEEGVFLGDEMVQAATVLWAAGVQASKLNKHLGAELDRQGRVKVEADCSLAGHTNVFVLGDQAHFAHDPKNPGVPLPGLCPVAIQQGKTTAQNILRERKGKPRKPFAYVDKGQMATIGRKRAICEIGRVRFRGMFAWMAWLTVHIYFLIGFRNRLMVILNWGWAYATFRRGARLIVSKDWRAHDKIQPLRNPERAPVKVASGQ